MSTTISPLRATATEAPTSRPWSRFWERACATPSKRSSNVPWMSAIGHTLSGRRSERRERPACRRAHDPGAKLLVHRRVVQEVEMRQARQLAAVVDLERDAAPLAVAP